MIEVIAQMLHGIIVDVTECDSKAELPPKLATAPVRVAEMQIAIFSESSGPFADVVRETLRRVAHLLRELRIAFDPANHCRDFLHDLVCDFFCPEHVFASKAFGVCCPANLSQESQVRRA